MVDQVFAARELGMASDERPDVAREAPEINQPATVIPFASNERKDYFVRKDGVEYAGTHLLVEFWDATNLSDVGLAEQALVGAAKAAGATVLNAFLHPFGGPDQGVSGVVVLAESHISIHTWPERGYAAIDLFMCGECDPYRGVAVLKEVFQPGSVQLSEHKRGLTP